MRRIPFRTVLENTFACMGQPLDITLTTACAQATRFINMRVDHAWSHGAWPEWTFCEQRAFANEWSATENYAATEVVYLTSTAKYYVALTDNTGSSPATNPGDWAATDLTVKTIGYEQTGKWRIGRAFRVTDKNPRQYPKVRTFQHIETDSGIAVVELSVPTLVWLEYQRPAPTFSSKLWSGGGNYSVGDTVLSPSDATDQFPQAGHCYQVQVDDNGDNFWALIEFPEVLADYVAFAAAADLQRYNGKAEQADALNAIAEDRMDEEMRKAGIKTQIEVSI